MIGNTLKMCTGDAGPEQSLVLFKISPGAENCTERGGGHMFYIGLYREKHEKSSCLKP